MLDNKANVILAIEKNEDFHLPSSLDSSRLPSHHTVLPHLNHQISLLIPRIPYLDLIISSHLGISLAENALFFFTSHASLRTHQNSYLCGFSLLAS